MLLKTIIGLTALLLNGCGGGGSDNKTETAPPPIQNVAPKVNAGEDQLVTGSALVTLESIATDSDGSISSYSWTQTSGTSVTMDSADSASTSFRIPDSSSDLALAFTVTASDNRGATATDSVEVKRLVGIIKGTVTFDLVPLETLNNGLDYDNVRRSPARGIVIEGLNGSGAIVGSTSTDDNGEYALTVDRDIPTRVRVTAQMLKTGQPAWDVRVTDNTHDNSQYAAQGDLATDASAPNRDFHFASGWDATDYSLERAAGPFAILDTIYLALQKFSLVDPSVQFPPLEIRWSTNNSAANGSIAEGDIGTSYYSDGKMYLLGKADSDSDEYDTHVILHEWAHYFEEYLSRSDSIGGSHSLGEHLDLRVAFSEGLGNALSGMITDDPVYRDSSGASQKHGFHFDVEANANYSPGWYSEGSVHSILYDLYDSEADEEDYISLGLRGIYDTLVSLDYKHNAFFTSIYSFIAALKSRNLDDERSIDALVRAQSIFGDGANAIGETNDGGLPSTLPIYKTVTVNGASLTMCPSGALAASGANNKMGNVMFASFEVVNTGAYSISVTKTSGGPSDPDIYIYKDGIVVSSSKSLVTDEEIATAELTSTGVYLIVIKDSKNRYNAQSSSACFSTQIKDFI